MTHLELRIISAILIGISVVAPGFLRKPHKCSHKTTDWNVRYLCKDHYDASDLFEPR